ncbi:N-acetylmuramoyl-L-alanine amidase [Numidum massiliense]|uniref:N-acetylmuramoyl-L-alanine amidase n=1 Tax=Numidum massiliense TaxID=1522315 RepID=UPI0006D538EE|nr:N-acetylmuramoyl-L-alanine amidase [Numidum massiliense]
MKIYIDPGHGGTDPGAVANGIKEKDVTLAIALKIRDYLKQYEGVSIKMSRTKDETVKLQTITNEANKWKADFLLSIHINAGGGTGFESYIYKSLSSGSKTAKIQNSIHAEIVKQIGMTDRGKKKADFHVLRESTMDALLTENGFIDRASDAKLMKDKKWIERVARGHVNGLAKAFSLKKKPSMSKPKPSPKPTPQPSGKLYRVQIGAFKDQKNAAALEAKAKKAGFDAMIKKEGTLYKVQLGAFKERKNADALAEKAKKAKFDVTINYS